MLFLIDAQLPIGLCRFIRSAGHEAKHVMDEGLLEADDSIIWNHASTNSMIAITKDEDFAQRRIFAKSGPVVVWIRVGNCSNSALLQWLQPLWPDVIARIEAGDSLIELV